MRRSAARLARFAEALAPTPSSSRADGRLVEPRTREWRREHHRFVSSHATRSSPAPPDVSADASAFSEPRMRDSAPRMRFASGLSKREDLSLAVVEAVAEVKASLGHDSMPTFVQVMVSSAYADPSAAPGFVLECFTRAEPEPPRVGSRDAHFVASTAPRTPALFGGTVTGAIGGAGAVVDGFGVSVFAGVMPGVEAVAFRVADASLPSQLTAAQWRRIAKSKRDHDHTRGVLQSHTNDTNDTNDEKNTSRERPPFVAALTLACADFEDIETFTGRLHAAAPGAVVVGAVAKPGGALFSGSEEVTSVPTRDAKDPGAKEGERSGSAGPFGDDATFSKTSSARVSSSSARASSCASHGAVGVILVGDFEMEAHSLHAHRPVGPPMTLTRAGADGVVLDLDGRAAGDALSERLADLPDGVAGMPVMLGMRDDDGFERFERTRSITGSGDTTAERRREDDTTDATTTTTTTKTTAVLTTFSSREENDAPDRGRRRRGRSAWIRGRVVAESVTPESMTSMTPDASEARGTPRAHAAAEAAAEAHAARAYGAGGAGYVYRDIVGADHETGGVFVGSTMALREGSRVQLHVRDAAWGKARVKALLAGISDTDSSETGSGPPAGAVMYTCVSGNRMHAGDFREAVAACPLGGGFVAGEIAPAERGARATLQSHTSVVAVFRERTRYHEC